MSRRLSRPRIPRIGPDGVWLAVVVAAVVFGEVVNALADYSHNSEWAPTRSEVAFLLAFLGLLTWLFGWLLAGLVGWLIRQVRPPHWKSTDD